MFENDICKCGNADLCPRKDDCRRAQKVIGIYTASNFYKNEEKCEYFWSIAGGRKNEKELGDLSRK